MLKFLCPNGHQLSAPENLAGKPGKCPKCSTPFVVPLPEEVAAAASGKRAVPGAGAVGDGSAANLPAMGSAKDLAAAGEAFMFLCPNGHKLNGPPSLKGKAGQCPHCGARFRIPTDEEMDELELPEEEEVPTGHAEEEEIPAGTPVEEGGIDFNRLFGTEAAQETSPDTIAPPPPGAAGLGYIVGRLWERRSEEAELEVFLSEGEIVAPDHYSEVLSSSEYGVFAVQEGDGSFAVTVIPWSTVRRVGMRRVTELPGELFQ